MNLAVGARNGQSLTLGLGRIATATGAGTLTGTLLRNSLLMDLCISSEDHGLVRQVSVAGQNLNVTNKGASIRMFDPAAQLEGKRSAGLPLKESLGVTVSITDHETAAGWVAAGWNTDPARGPVGDISDAGEALNWFGGLGTVNVVASSGATQYSLTATVERDCLIGPLVIDHGGTAGDIMIQDVLINGLQMLSGGNTAAERSVPAEMYAFDATDLDGRIMGVEVGENTNITVNLVNYDGAVDIEVYGGFYCMPRVADLQEAI